MGSGMPTVVLDAPYVCKVCGRGFADGELVRPGPAGLEHAAACGAGAASQIVELTDDAGLMDEQSIEAQAARAGFSDHAIITARDGTVRLLQAVVYRREDRVGVAFTAWPVSLTDMDLGGTPGVRVGVQAWEMTVADGPKAAQERFVRLVDEVGQVSRRIEARYCVGRRQP